jgi:menaquinone-dependent protoporphyrinogen IX oxidase
MKAWILYETRFGNGKKLAEYLKKEFPSNIEVRIGDVKEISPDKVAKNKPNILIVGGAIRMFRGGPKSKKWLKKLNKRLEEIDHKIKYATGFFTHGLPTDKVQGYAKRFLKKFKKASMIKKSYDTLLTARVKEQEGPILDDEMQKSKKYIQDFLTWTKK